VGAALALKQQILHFMTVRAKIMNAAGTEGATFGRAGEY